MEYAVTVIEHESRIAVDSHGRSTSEARQAQEQTCKSCRVQCASQASTKPRLKGKLF